MTTAAAASTREENEKKIYLRQRRRTKLFGLMIFLFSALSISFSLRSSFSSFACAKAGKLETFNSATLRSHNDRKHIVLCRIYEFIAKKEIYFLQPVLFSLLFGDEKLFFFFFFCGCCCCCLLDCNTPHHRPDDDTRTPERFFKNENRLKYENSARIERRPCGSQLNSIN